MKEIRAYMTDDGLIFADEKLAKEHQQEIDYNKALTSCLKEIGLQSERVKEILMVGWKAQALRKVLEEHSEYASFDPENLGRRQEEVCI